jgi:hypothetical protein
MVDEHNHEDAELKRKQIRQSQEMAKLDQLISELAGAVKTPDTFKAIDLQIRRIFAAYAEDDTQIINTQIRYHFKDQLDNYLRKKNEFAEINRSYASSWGIEIPQLNSKKQDNVVDLSNEDSSINLEDVIRDLDKNKK